MHNASVRASSTIAFVFILAGCGARSAYVPAPGAPAASTESILNRGWMSAQAKAGKHLLYVADEFNQTVWIFPQSGKNPAPIGAITQGVSAPDGLFVDRHKALYVTNFGAGTVTVYPHGSTTPSKTLTGAGVAPIDVVVGRDGTVYVADFNEGQSGHIFEYANGSTTPTTTIALSGYPEGLALDHSNNLYAAYQKTPSGATVLKFAPGSTTGNDLGLPLTLVGGATIDAQDNLLVVDQSNPAPHVDVFPPGAKVPSQKIGGFALAFDLALDGRNNRFYLTQNQNPAVVYEVSYPGGTILQQITNTIVTAYGVASSPDGSP